MLHENDLITSVLAGSTATVPALFRARVAASPERLFLSSGERRWSYAEALAEVERFAGYLQSRGFRLGDRVAALLGKCPEGLWAWLGTVAMGGVFVGLNRMHQGDILADQMTRSRASILVTDDIPPADAPFETILSVGDGAGTTAYAAATTAPPFGGLDAKPGQACSIVFTSGTTGRSKAVLTSHNQLCRGAARLAEGFGLGPDDVIYDYAPLYHLSGQMHAALTAIVAGASLAEAQGFSASNFWQDVARTGATYTMGYPAMVHILLSRPPTDDDAYTPLRKALIAGIDRADRDAFERRFGVSLLDSYGMSEAEPVTLLRAGAAHPAGSVGQVSDDFEILIADEQDLPVPAGSIGRILIRPRTADAMMLGYEGDEAATLESLRNLWFHSQDLGRIDEEGHLHYHGRLKHSIRRRGENISAMELEQIVRGHPAVVDCVVVGVPSPLGEQDVKAIVSIAPDQPTTPAQLHGFCLANMARFMVPRYIEIVDALAYAEHGKVVRDGLERIDASTWDAEAR